jgi:LysM repeat protein
VLDTAPTKEKVETPVAKPDVATGHANNEALALLGQQSGGMAKSAEPTSGVLDFGHGGDLFKSASNSSLLGKGGESSTSFSPVPRDGGGPARSDAPGHNDATAGPGAAPATRAGDHAGANFTLPHMTVPKDESIKDFAKGVLGKDAAAANLNLFVNEVAQFNHLDPNAMLRAGQDVMTPKMAPGGPQPGDGPSPQPARPGDTQPTGPAKPADAQGETYTVKPGDNLWKIEKQHLGPHASNADILKGVNELAKANHIPLHTDSHGHVTALIKPGQKLHLPPAHGHGDHNPQPHRPGHPDVPHPAPHTPDVPPPAPHAPDAPPPPPDKPAPAPDVPPPAPDKPVGPGGDKPIDPKDKPADGKPDPHKFDSPEKQQLVKDAEEKYKNQPDKLAEFKGNMKALEDRAGKDHLSPQEVAKTYGQIDRLMEAKGNQPTTPEQRQHLAEQVMKQAAHPYDIDQGQHNTCAINNGVEVRAYTKNPSEAAKLVTDVATTGQYTTKDGATIKVDPTPHGESTWNPTPDGSRTHASEIFQLTAANIRLDKQNKSTNPPGQLHYEHYDAPPGSGRHDEAIMDHSTNPPTYKDDSPGFNTGNDGSLRDIYQSITGVHETGTVIGRDTYLNDSSDAVQKFHTEKEMNDYLAQAKKDGKFPVSVIMDTTSEPFWSDSGNGTAGGSGGGHVITVTDYHPGNPPTVEVQNSWGTGSEHLGNKAISSHDLFMAMDAPANKAKDMQQDVDAARAQGHPDHWKELEEARLEHATKHTGGFMEPSKEQNDKDYEQKVQQEMQRMQQDWASNPDPADRAKSMQKLNNMIQSFSPEAQQRLQNEEHRLGLN